MNKQQQQYFAKIERAMASIQVRSGYCLADSESEDMPHVVSTNEKLYSTHCTCKAARKGLDCYHRISVDRYFDAQRTAERKQGAFTPAATLARYDIHVAVDKVVAQAEIDLAIADHYELVGA